MIIRAEISHYKSIAEASLSFRERVIIVGPNGAGKSNILDAIYFLRDCVVDDIDTAVTKRHGIDSIRQWSRTRPYNIIILLQFQNARGSGSYRVAISSSKGNYKVLEEYGSWSGPNPRYRLGVDQDVGYSSFSRAEDGSLSFQTTFSDYAMDRPTRIDPEELFLTSLGGRIVVPPFSLFRPIADELSSFSKYNIYPNTLRDPQLVSKDPVLRENGANVGSILKRVNSNRRLGRNKEDILAAVKMLMPSVSDIQVRSAGGYYVPVLRVEEQNGDLHDFNLSQISDGTLRTLGLLTAFYQPNAPEKIGIEEPEQMIHPGALPVFAEAMTDFVNGTPSLAGRDRQVFITTHSPTLLDLVDPSDIVWARFKKGVTECGSVSKRQLTVIKEQLFTAGELLLSEGYFA